MILFCIFIMANDVEHYFMGWFDLCVSSWLKCFLPIFCPFVIRFCCFYYWVWEFLIYSKYLSYIYSFLVAQTVKKICMQCRRFEFDPWGGSLGKRNGYPLPVFLPGEFHGQRSLAGYSPWGCKRVGHDWSTNTTVRRKDIINCWQTE